MARIRADYVFGVLTGGGIDAVETTIASPQLARLPVVTAPDVAALTLHDQTSGEYEIVHVTDHTAGATSATVLRAQEGSDAATWAEGTPWVLGITQEDVAEFATGGSGGGWDLVVDNPLSALTGFTSASGTWTVDAGVIRQTATSATQYRLMLDAGEIWAHCIVEVDVRMNTATSTAAGARAGVAIGARADNLQGEGVYLATAASTTTPLSRILTEADTVTAYADIPLSPSLSVGTWYTLRVLKAGRSLAVFIDGTRVGGVNGNSTASLAVKSGLYCYGADASFRNLKIWTPTLPA